MKRGVVAGNHSQFTRVGQYGVQEWKGILKKEKGVLRIVDGRRAKAGRSSGVFTAEEKK